MKGKTVETYPTPMPEDVETLGQLSEAGLQLLNDYPDAEYYDTLGRFEDHPECSNPFDILEDEFQQEYGEHSLVELLYYEGRSPQRPDNISGQSGWRSVDDLMNTVGSLSRYVEEVTRHEKEQGIDLEIDEAQEGHRIIIQDAERLDELVSNFMSCI